MRVATNREPDSGSDGTPPFDPGEGTSAQRQPGSMINDNNFDTETQGGDSLSGEIDPEDNYLRGLRRPQPSRAVAPDDMDQPHVEASSNSPETQVQPTSSTHHDTLQQQNNLLPPQLPNRRRRRGARHIAEYGPIPQARPPSRPLRIGPGAGGHDGQGWTPRSHANGHFSNVRRRPDVNALFEIISKHISS